MCAAKKRAAIDLVKLSVILQVELENTHNGGLIWQFVINAVIFYSNIKDFLVKWWLKVEGCGTLRGRSGVKDMFLGEYHHSIDNKGRIIIPSKFREALGESFVITRGLDQCLFGYPRNEWSEAGRKAQRSPAYEKGC